MFSNWGNHKRRISSSFIRVFICCLLVLYANFVNAGINKWTTNGPDGGLVKMVEMDPNDPNILYAGTGSFYSGTGSGLYKSTNAGLSWFRITEKLAELISLGNPSGLEFGPQANAIYFATTTGLFKSGDNGVTWEILLENQNVSAVGVNPNNANNVYVYTQAGLLVSNDGGITWSLRNNQINFGFTKIVVDPSNATIIHAMGTTGYYVSADSGFTWTLKNTGLLNTYVFGSTIDSSHLTEIYAATGAGIFKTIDSGANWLEKNAGIGSTFNGARSIFIDPSDPLTLYTAIPYLGVYRSIDGAENWAYLNSYSNGLFDQFPGSLNISPLSGVIYSTTSNNGIFKSLDAGLSWTQSSAGLHASSVNDLMIDESNPQIIYATEDGAGVYRTNNGSVSWGMANNGLGQKRIFSIAIDTQQPSTLYAGSTGDGQVIFKSTDSGDNWATYSFGFPNATAYDILIDPTNSLRLLAVTSNGFYISEDGALNWAASNTGLTDLFLKSAIFDPNNSNILYAVSNTAGIFKSNDGGVNWTASSNGIPNTTIYTLAADPVNGNLFASTFGMLYKSEDSGNVWLPLSSEIPFYAYSLVIDPTNTNVMYAAGPKGVFKSANSGQNWYELNDGLIPTFVRVIAIDPTNSSNLVVGSSGGGVYHLTQQNRNPTPTADQYLVDESATLSINAPGLLGNDTDPDIGDTLSVVATPATAPTHGTLTLSADGSFTYMHDGSETTSDTFTYKVSDGALTSTATVTITINPVNDPPVANNDIYALDEGATFSVDTANGLLVNDTDADINPADTLIVSTTPLVAPLYGSLTLNADGSFTYTHDGSETTSDSFQYQMSDGSTIGTATVNLTINPVNDPPAAVDDSGFSVNEGEVMGVIAPGLLGNDTDAENNPLTIDLTPVSGPANGTLNLSADGSFTYTHDGSETTSDTFTYKVSDGALTSTAIVTLTVNPVNDPPVANNDNYALDEGATLSVDTANGLLTNDNDADINPVDTLIVSTTPLVAPLYGSLTLNTDGSFTYTHDGSETTGDSFQYQMSDGSVTATATVTLTINPVNDPPTANTDSYTLDEGATLSKTAANGVLTNDSDAENNPLTVSTTLVSSPSNGSVTLNADGSFSYTHNGDETRIDSFQYQVSDGADTAVGTVNITINPVNDPPVANADSYTVDEGAGITISAALGLLSNDTDPDLNPKDTLTVSTTAVSAPLHGSLSLNTDGSFTYTHDGTETTGDSFQYQMSDGSVTRTATVALTINPVNDPPVAVNDSGYSVAEGGTLNIPAPGLLSNDTDVENDALTVSVTPVSTPAHGTVTLNSDGSFSYAHDGSETSSDSFDYQISDGAASASASVSIVITPVNDAPVGNNNNFITDEDTLYNGQLSGSDAENDPLSYAIVSFPSKGSLSLNQSTGAYTYTPNANTNGADAFTFLVNDGQLDSLEASVDISITPINDLPVANDATLLAIEDTPASGVANASDVDGGDTLSYRIDTVPSLGNVTLSSSTGAYIYTPNTNQTGSDFFTFIVNDGAGDSNTGRIDITIQPLQDQPLASDGSLITDEDTAQSGQLIAVDADPLDVLSYAIASVASHGSVDLDSATGTYTYTPNANYHGSDSFTFTASDGTNTSDSATINIVINPVNDAPVASNGQLNTSEDTAVQNQLIASDVDQDSLTYSLVSPPGKGTLQILNAVNGTYRYTPNANQTGADSFSFKVSDGLLESNVANIVVTIDASNDAPVANAQNIDVDEDGSVAITLTGSDADNESLSYAIETQPSRGSLTGSAPNLTYVPNADYYGTDSFVFSVTDPSNASHNATVTITVNAQNDAPLAQAGSLRVEQDTDKVGSLTATDVDGDALSYSVVAQGGKGQVEITDAATGQYTYRPNSGAMGRDQFTFVVNDGTAFSATATVKININAFGNEAPSVPQLLAPASSARVVGTTATLTWERAQDSNGDQLYYELVYCDNPDFNACTPIQVAQGDYSGAAYLALGSSGAGIMLLGLMGAPRRRMLSILLMMGGLIILNACSNAANEVSEPSIDKPAVTSISYTVNGLSSQTTYYWKVIVDDNRGGATESAVRSFSTT